MGSRLNVISSEARNLFIPDRSVCGLVTTVVLALTDIGLREGRGWKREGTYGVAVAETAG